jgi:hypothetical protein
MSPSRPDSTTTTVTAAPADAGTRPVPSRAEAPPAPRRMGVDAPAPAVAPEIAGERRQIVMVANVLDATGRTDAAAAGSRDVFGRAVVDVHEVSEAFGGETIAVLGTHVVTAFPYDQAADAVTAAVEIQRDAARSAGGSQRWSCAVCLVAGDVIDHPAFERIGVHPVGPVVERALQLSRRATPGSVVADERTALPAAGRGGARADADRTPGSGGAGAPPASAGATGDAAIGSSTAWTLGPNRVLLDQGDEPVACYEIVFDAHTSARAARASVSTSAGAGRGPRPAPGNRRARPGGAPREGRNLAAMRRRPWSEGRVFCWFSDRGRGVITSTTGQEFYVDRRFLAVGSELAAGDHVYFVPRDPVARGRNPVAGAVLGDGARLEVRIETPGEGDGSALAVVSDSNGTDQILPLDVSSLGPVATGEWLLVRIDRQGGGGPVGGPV